MHIPDFVEKTLHHKRVPAGHHAKRVHAALQVFNQL